MFEKGARDCLTGIAFRFVASFDLCTTKSQLTVYSIRSMRSESRQMNLSTSTSTSAHDTITHLPARPISSSEDIITNRSHITTHNSETSNHVLNRPPPLPPHNPRLRPPNSLPPPRALLPPAPPLPPRLTPRRARNHHRRAPWPRHGQGHCLDLAATERDGCVRSVLLGAGISNGFGQGDDEHRRGGIR
jgi:hypothetical protein